MAETAAASRSEVWREALMEPWRGRGVDPVPMVSYSPKAPAFRWLCDLSSPCTSSMWVSAGLVLTPTDGKGGSGAVGQVCGLRPEGHASPYSEGGEGRQGLKMCKPFTPT